MLLVDDATQSAMHQVLPVTVVVPIKNEERNLGACLERLGRFAKVVVIDSGSTDASKEITLGASADWVDFNWNGRFPKKRNWYLRNHQSASFRPQPILASGSTTTIGFSAAACDTAMQIENSRSSALELANTSALMRTGGATLIWRFTSIRF